MLDRIDSARPPIVGTRGCVPKLTIKKLGIVSRDYNVIFGEHFDFSHVLPDVLQMLDEQCCDAVLFSLYSIIPRESFAVRDALSNLNCINAVFLEEFHALLNGACDAWKPGDQVVYHRSNGEWQEYRIRQAFGSLTDFGGSPDRCMKAFIADEHPKRLLGNCCVLICGESNGVRWSKNRQKVEDTYKLRADIPGTVKIVLNPGHDRMGFPHVMNNKRKFLSCGGSGRWIVSVWNRGGNNGDGPNPPWKVFYKGKEKKIDRIDNNLRLEIGILNIEPPM